MSALSRSSPTAVVGTRKEEIRGFPLATLRFELVAALLSASIIGGFVVDTWAHNHDRADTTFFTPWHALLYGAMAVTGLFLFMTWVRNRATGYAWQRALPAGYGLSLAGVALFAVAGVLDMGWHLLFGIEVSIDALLSPTHLLLALAGLLIVAGPLRSAWSELPGTARQRVGWRGLAPALISATTLLVLLVGLTQYAHPLVSVEAAKRDARQVPSDIYVMSADGTGAVNLTNNAGMESLIPSWSPDGKKIAYLASGHSTEPDPFFRQALGISSILLQSALLMGLLLTIARRWRLPIGALTMLIGVSSVAMVVQRDQTSLLPAALAAGIAADLLYVALRPSADRLAQPWRFYLFAALVPAVFYGLHLVTLLATVGVGWSVHMTVGAILLAGIAGLLVSFLVLPPMREATAQVTSLGVVGQLVET